MEFRDVFAWSDLSSHIVARTTLNHKFIVYVYMTKLNLEATKQIFKTIVC